MFLTLAARLLLRLLVMRPCITKGVGCDWRKVCGLHWWREDGWFAYYSFINHARPGVLCQRLESWLVT